MRSFTASACGCLSSLILMGCSPDNVNFFNAGVGTDLYATTLVQSAALEDLYLGWLCDHSGIPVAWNNSSPACVGLGAVSTDWNLIVQAGMNDIDLRCDEYLTWLDNRRRSQAPVIKQLGDMSSAAQAIMTIAGTGASAIGIVGVAFGIATNTFTNVNSRLLYDVNNSTVQSIVLSNDNRFRQELLGVTINNRPAAIYALRSYLRLCMPYTIETQINNAVTFFQVGGVASQNAIRNPLISATNVETAQIAPLKASTPATFKPERPRRVSAQGWGQVSSSTTIDVLTGKAIRKSLCMPEGDGSYNKNVGYGLKMYWSVAHTKDGIRDLNWQTNNVQLGSADVIRLEMNLAQIKP